VHRARSLCGVEGNTMPQNDHANLNPNHPFPDADSRQQAENAATDALDRFTRAKRALQVAATSGSTADVAEALRTASNLTAYLHRLIAVGWWHDRPF